MQSHGLLFEWTSYEQHGAPEYGSDPALHEPKKYDQHRQGIHNIEVCIRPGFVDFTNPLNYREFA